jgi:hypothetical protein
VKPVDKNNKRKRALKGFNNTYLDIEPHSGLVFNFHFDPRASPVVIGYADFQFTFKSVRLSSRRSLRTCKTVKFKGSYIKLKLNQLIIFDFLSLICEHLWVLRYLRALKVGSLFPFRGSGLSLSLQFLTKCQIACITQSRNNV